MKIDIRTNDLTLNRRDRSKVENHLLEALARYEKRIGRVNVYLRDVNGPRSGIDHRCRIAVHLPTAERVVVTGSGAELMPTVKRTAERAAFAVRRSVNRRRAVKRRRAVALV